MRRSIQDAEIVARFARNRIQLNQCRNACGIHPLDGRKVQCDRLSAHQRRHACNQIPFVAKDKFVELGSARHGEDLSVIVF
jgi:hypothetical protein